MFSYGPLLKVATWVPVESAHAALPSRLMLQFRTSSASNNGGLRTSSAAVPQHVTEPTDVSPRKRSLELSEEIQKPVG